MLGTRSPAGLQGRIRCLGRGPELHLSGAHKSTVISAGMRRRERARLLSISSDSRPKPYGLVVYPSAKRLESSAAGRVSRQSAPADIIVRKALMEEIARGVCENLSRLCPAKRFVQLFLNKSEVKSLPKGFSGMRRNRSANVLCLAMLTTWTELGASANRVPCWISPFNLCCHLLLSF